MNFTKFFREIDFTKKYLKTGYALFCLLLRHFKVFALFFPLIRVLCHHIAKAAATAVFQRNFCVLVILLLLLQEKKKKMTNSSTLVLTPYACRYTVTTPKMSFEGENASVSIFVVKIKINE